jgi:segregation and condensation protein A
VNVNSVNQSEHQPTVLAKVKGRDFSDKPDDLFIPPDALEVFLEAFEGPLDLLLYLIKRKKMDVLELPVNEITAQYIEYVELMKDLKLELAADYLVMAAFLVQVKSRLLLPRYGNEEDEDEDPRAALLRRLQEYQVFKLAAEQVDSLPRQDRDFFVSRANPAPEVAPVKVFPEVTLQELAVAFGEVCKRAEAFTHHHVQRENLSTRERMGQILEMVNTDSFTRFEDLFDLREGKAGAVVTFLAILELIKGSLDRFGRPD